ncbi:amidohydrolase family protein [Niabella terrae]
MRWTKLYPDQIFDGYRIHSGKVLILDRDNRVEALLPAGEAGEELQPLKGLLTPGFINCHCHLELSHMQGQIAEGTGLTGFVREVIRQRQQPEDRIVAAIEAADTAMQEAGIVAVGDICNTTDTIRQKAVSPIYYHNFVEAMGADPAVADKNFTYYQQLKQQWVEAAGPRRVSLTPHAPYSVSEELMTKILAAGGPQPLQSIHNQETQDENQWFISGTGAFEQLFTLLGIDTRHFQPSGQNSLPSYGRHFAAGQQWLLVHNVATAPADIDFAMQAPASVYWCLCPNANWYISRQLPNLTSLVSYSDRIVLGTDSLASNHQLSILAEIKTLRQHRPDLRLEQLLQWATLNGARALRIDDRFGSFEKGKIPGRVLIDPETI